MKVKIGDEELELVSFEVFIDEATHKNVLEKKDEIVHKITLYNSSVVLQLMDQTGRMLADNEDSARFFTKMRFVDTQLKSKAWMF